MNFMTLGDNGQMLPVHQCLRIMAGNDFEKCAREYTIFHYNNMNPGFETHTKFWNGRKFEVLMVPLKTYKDAVWVKAEVHNWEEYNMGPGDRFMKWTLNAKFTPDDSKIAVGSLVTYPTNEEGKQEEKYAAVVTQIDEVETDEGNKIMMCTLCKCNSSKSKPERWELEELQPFDGTMEFHVFKMNVQGGGILSYNRAEQEAFTMKWLEPELGIPEERDGFKYWYFDPAQIQCDPAELVKDDRVQQLRRDYLKKIEGNEHEMLWQAGIRKIIIKESFERLKEGSTPDVFDTEPFEKLLLCIPYFLYADLIVYYIDLHDGNDEARHTKFKLSAADEEGIDDVFDSDEDWCLVFYSLIKIGMYLRHDEEWQNANSKGFSFVMQSSDMPKEEQLYNIFLNINGFVGEWFEKVKEFRAALWCYNHNLATSQGEHLVNLKCNIALAHKRMDNFAVAHKYYEEAILLAISIGRPKQQMGLLIDNANTLQQAVKDWFGTSGHLPPFTTEDASLEANNKCQSCNAIGATKSCSACHIVCYCNIDCQKEHWKKVHKRTCVGKMRNK